MSSLEAQLASLDADNKHPGSIYTSSTGNRRHEDAVGRGVQFSVQTGKTMPSGSDPKFKPTLLWESPREAADVPLRDIEAQASNAMIVLREHEESFDFDITRAGATDLHTDGSIPKILLYLTAFLGENDPAIQQHSLEVLEYLIRKYDVHLKYMQDFLWAILPQHQRLPVVFHRGLSLLDLASNQSYLWLRPYADPKHSSTVPRQLIARNVFHNIDLLRYVVKLASSVHRETESRGGAYLLSFTAAILVEGLQIYAQQPARNDEQIISILLPPILSACKNKGQREWTNWGFLLASYVSDVMDLSKQTVYRIGKSILSGSSSPDAIMTIITLVLPPPKQPIHNESYLFLPAQKAIGCELPKKLFDLLMSVEKLPFILGSIRSDGNLSLEPFVASLLAYSADYSSEHLASLLNEPGLSFMRNGPYDIIGSLASRATLRVLHGGEVNHCRRVIDVLRSLDRSACDSGIAGALHENPDIAKENQVAVLELIGISGYSQKHSRSSSRLPMPPLIELEHSDPEVRLDAVERLSSGENDSTDLIFTFLKLVSAENDVHVASCAMKKVVIFLDRDRKLGIDQLKTWSRMVSSCFSHWASSASKELSDLLNSAATKLAPYLRRVDKSLFMELLLHIIDSKFSVKKSQDSLKQLLGEVLGSGDPRQTVSTLFDELELMLSVKRTGRSPRVRLAVISLAVSVGDSLLKSPGFVEAFLSVIAEILDADSRLANDFFGSPEFLEFVLQCVECGDSLNVHSFIVSLASTKSAQTHEKVSVPILSKIHSSSKCGVVYYSLLSVNNVFLVRLLGFLSERIAGDQPDPSSCKLILLPLLHCIDRGNKSVDAAVIECCKKLSSKSTKKKDRNSVQLVCDFIVKNKALLPGGQLSMLLSLVSAEKEAKFLRETVLSLCVDFLNYSTKLPLPSFESTVKIIESFEVAGEDAFGLLERWEHFGRHALSFLLKNDGVDDTRSTHLSIMISRILKGVIVSEPSIIISTSPSIHGRRRSYSVSREEGVKFVSPYPDEFFRAIFQCLESQMEGKSHVLVQTILDEVVASISWQKEILGSAKTEIRHRLLHTLRDLPQIPGCNKYNFPSLYVHDDDMVVLLKSMDACSDPFSAMEVVALLKNHLSNEKTRVDVIRKLSSILFDALNDLAVVDTTSSIFEGVCYLRELIVSALAVNSTRINGKLCPNVKCARSWFPILINSTVLKTLPNSRREEALELAKHIAKEYPTDVLQFLGDLFRVILSPQEDGRLASRVLFHLFPPLWIGSGETRRVLFTELGSAALLSTVRGEIADVMLHSLVASDLVPKSERYAALGVSLLSILAVTMRSTREMGSTGFSKLLSSFPRNEQLSALLCYLDCCADIVSTSCMKGHSSSTVASNIPCEEIISLLPPRGEQSDEDPVLAFVEKALLCASDTIVSERFSGFIKDDQEGGKLILPIWHSLLFLHSLLSDQYWSKVGFSTRNIEVIKEVVLVAKDRVQNLMPSPVFLASITDLMSEESSDDHMLQGLRYLSDRLEICSINENESCEHVLFLDVVPVINGILSKRSTNHKRHNMSVEQGSFIALDRICRLFCQSMKGKHRDAENIFRPLFSCIRRYLEDYDLGSVSAEMFSFYGSMALCAASLVRLFQARSMKDVPPLLDGFTSIVVDFNTRCLDEKSLAEERDEKYVVCFSFVKFFSTVLETVPATLSSRLSSILSKDCFLSKSIRGFNLDSDIHGLVKELDDCIAQRVPLRILFPALRKVLSGLGKSDCESVCSLLDIVTKSVSSASLGQLAPFRDPLITMMLSSFEKYSTESDHDSILSRGRTALLAIVLRSSEFQLRNIFSKLKTWKDIDSSTDDRERMFHRRAFWLLSESLSEKLKSLYLPCLSLCLTDLLNEIDEPLSKHFQAPGHTATKKRKLDKEKPTADRIQQEILSSCLLVLDRALRQDGHEGGDWVRADENKRFFLILGKVKGLFQADARIISENYTYHELVFGTRSGMEAEEGSLISVVSALAAAAGDDNLWKPLNQVILDACSNEDRLEVRRAGLSCLHKVMKSVGEEYMVLLPESLPVLSDLLEDSSDEISSLARQIVSLAEDVLGESLEDSLR